MERSVGKENKVRSEFRVIGPNTANYQQSTWYFPTLEAARKFAEVMAHEVDAEYDIVQLIGTVRQVPLPSRPLEWIAAYTEKKPSRRKKSETDERASR